MKCEFTVIIYDGVAGIGSTLKSYDDISFFSQHIGNLTFSFIAPVCSYDCSYHNTVPPCVFLYYSERHVLCL